MQGAYDTHSITETDWEGSSFTFHIKSTTASMNNYMEFSGSVDAGSVSRGGEEVGDGVTQSAISDTAKGSGDAVSHHTEGNGSAVSDTAGNVTHNAAVAQSASGSGLGGSESEQGNNNAPQQTLQEDAGGGDLSQHTEDNASNEMSEQSLDAGSSVIA